MGRLAMRRSLASAHPIAGQRSFSNARIAGKNHMVIEHREFTAPRLGHSNIIGQLRQLLFNLGQTDQGVQSANRNPIFLDLRADVVS